MIKRKEAPAGLI